MLHRFQVVGVRGGLGLCHMLRKMVCLQLLDLELVCSWWVPGLNICPNLWGLFHKASSMWVSGICGRLPVCHCSVDGMALRKSYQIPSCCKTWSIRLFLNSVPLSDKMYHGHMCTGKYSLINVETIASEDLSGIGNASDHPVRWSMIVSMCLLPDVDVSHSGTRSMAILLNSLSGISIIL